ncbi:glycosyltransferase [Parabacteroides sp.]
MENMKNEFEQALYYLMLNSSFLPDLGLFQGKMGCVLFLMHYARLSKSVWCEDFAGELLNEIYEDIHVDVPFNLESGLCGIGWGIEYLLRNGFMEGDADEILEDIDRLVMEHDVDFMSDLSFRHGIGGIVFYVTSRLAYRENRKSMPFNRTYLERLRNRVLSSGFLVSDEIPPFLVKDFMDSLQGTLKIKMEIPDLLLASFPLTYDYEAMPIGLEKGLAGCLLNQIMKVTSLQVQINDCLLQNAIILFDEETRAAQYGIGTYIQSIVDVVKGTGREIQVIHLRSHKTKSLLKVKENGVCNYYIANPIEKGYSSDQQEFDKRYYRNIVFLIAPYLQGVKSPVFHLNYMKMTELALSLKGYFPSAKIVATVHYTSWSFDLLGDKNRLLALLKNCNRKDRYIVNNFEKEKLFLKNCDHIIAIAKHSYDDILELYGISPDKISLISHGVKDCYKPCSSFKRKQIRFKYGFSERDKILVFGGRLDEVKGIQILMDVFHELASQDEHLKLLIIGDGLIGELLPKCKPYWSRCVFTGFVNKETLYELFSMGDLGVLPALHEEFGYVALEMIMMNLPLVISGTTGLLELVTAETGTIVELNLGKEIQESKKNLQDVIVRLLQNPDQCRSMASAGRELYLNRFNFNIFRDKMIEMYAAL